MNEKEGEREREREREGERERGRDGETERKKEGERNQISTFKVLHSIKTIKNREDKNIILINKKKRIYLNVNKEKLISSS